ncbi:MAG: hypothetical protein QG581_259 [Patescibacteria group bacterium]|jgi:hypothetical protein|nr:hypothetical protein [Patescibacteria group bacterium]
MGLFRLDRVHFQNMQADLDGMVANLAITMINANFITKAKNAFAQAFAPSFASVLA